MMTATILSVTLVVLDMQYCRLPDSVPVPLPFSLPDPIERRKLGFILLSVYMALAAFLVSCSWALDGSVSVSATGTV